MAVTERTGDDDERSCTHGDDALGDDHDAGQQPGEGTLKRETIWIVGALIGAGVIAGIGTSIGAAIGMVIDDY